MNVTTNNELLLTVALAALHQVIDPEIGLNIVDLGLLYDIHFDDEENKIDVNMTLTTQFCPMGESITQDVTRTMGSAFPTYSINVNLSFDPPWRPDRISPEGQEFLNR
ncbi:MAG: metal-sulfur cluster assembly factor [Bacteroidetes bacterium]|nr:metal-sulfur cluster assembly factor [Bacteroidota bacterium]